MQRETMNYDVVIVGAGPAGLTAAIHLKQLAAQQQTSLDVCIVEKAAEIGGHILSGAVIETRSLDELIPDWKEQGAPLNTQASKDSFYYLTKDKAFSLPVPPTLKNHGNYIVSLSQFCRWLGEYAQGLGIDIFPGFAATELLYSDTGAVAGIITGDMGLDKQGQSKATFQPGIALQARQVMIAEGCRGSLTKTLETRYELRDTKHPQTYGIGIKELWEIDKTLHKPGNILHTIGWPLDNKTYGGSFLYHWGERFLSVGFVVGLDYENPYLDPFAELQRFKLHPAIKPLLVGGTRVGYGARAISEGGLQAIPTLAFPGGVLIGDCAGFLNVAKIKGTHTAMKSAIEAAKQVFNLLQSSETSHAIADYKPALQASWMWPELKKVRNIRPAFRKGLWPGLLYSAFDAYILRGHAPWTFQFPADYQQLKLAKDCMPIEYPKPDQVFTFDKLSSVYLSNVRHEENQPCHLQLTNPALAIDVNLQQYASPETRYCPANVYEIVTPQNQSPYLQINAQNCIQCKTCDIKDPKQNIQWVPPEGGSGPCYTEM